MGILPLSEALKATYLAGALFTIYRIFIFGPHILLIVALLADLGTRKFASSVTGFIDAMGYLGVGLTGVETGYLVEKFGWNAGFYFRICEAIFAVIMTLFLWNYKKKD